MSLIDGRTARVLFTVFVFAVGLGFLYVARRTLIAFLFAVFFAYLVDPAVSRVEKWTKGRGRSIAVIYLLIVVPILAAFFLKDGSSFSQVLLSFVHTKPQREFLQGVLSDMNQMLAQFIRAQITLAALSWIAYCVFLRLTDAQYTLMLGTAGGLLEFIPVVGPLVAAALILSVALLTGYTHWLIALAFLIAWRLVQDYVVSPRIMGKSMELHPLGAIFGVLAGGEIAGVLGVYLSIPVMASLRIVWRRWRMYAEKRRFGPLNEYSFLTETSPQK